ncbi:MAG: dihydroorotase [Firmicutes bacterium]|nr:dihydroorotase [Bacillota bacterium]
MTDRVNPNRIKTMTIDNKDVFAFPGFVDVHVHLREPGFCYKETVATGTASAAAGGFTCILSMPNLNPCPDSIENLKVQQDAIDKDAIVKTIPYGAITVGEKGEVMADIDGLADKVVAFTDDGVGVMNDDYMEEAMIKAKKYGKLVVAHCEDNNYPRESSEAEYKQLARDLELVRKTGCSYHMCHVSTKESVELIRQAKAEGLDVTCETAAHYLLLTRDDVYDAIGEMAEGGRPAGRFKMNPPIKFEEDRQALIEALKDGTIDMLATDHAPHSAEEKGQEFDKCAFGIIGLETAFPVLYSRLVKEGIITLEKLIELMAIAPAKRFGLPVSEGDYTVWDLDEEYVLDPSTFKTMGRATPFDGWKVNGRCLKTFVEGKEVYSYDR